MEQSYQQLCHAGGEKKQMFPRVWRFMRTYQALSYLQDCCLYKPFSVLFKLFPNKLANGLLFHTVICCCKTTFREKYNLSWMRPGEIGQWLEIRLPCKPLQSRLWTLWTVSVVCSIDSSFIVVSCISLYNTDFREEWDQSHKNLIHYLV